MPTKVPMLQAPASAAQRTIGLPSTVSGRNGSTTDVSRQANSPHSTADARVSAPISQVIQAKRTPAPGERQQQHHRRQHHQQRADQVEAVLRADATAPA